MKSHIQIFFENLLLSTLTLGKVFLLSNPFLRLPDIRKKEKSCVILANGPSLNDLIHNHDSFLKGKVLFCVNLFARTEHYTRLKPSVYVITSPEYWLPDEKKGWHEDRLKTFEELVTKTQWPLTLLVPIVAKKDRSWVKYMHRNSQIRIAYFNNTPIEGFKWLNHIFFNLNLGIPRPHNVLIPSLFIAVRCHFPKIYLAGADHNWLQEISVTGENEVLLSQKHFYDRQFSDKNNKNSPNPRPMYHGSSARKRKLHEVLIKFYLAFKGYWDIRDYANSRNVEIVNLTTNSYIDAFVKEDLTDQ